MAEARGSSEPSPEAKRRSLRGALAVQRQPLRVVAENVLGAQTRIDLVAIGTEGETLLVLLGEPGRDLELVARGLAQRVWVEARLADWLQLAPDLGARPEAGVRALLLCAAFGPEALAAASSVTPEWIELATCHFGREGSELRVWIDRVGRAEARAARASPAPEPVASFRTGLSDADLGVSAEEQSALERNELAPREPSSSMRLD